MPWTLPCGLTFWRYARCSHSLLPFCLARSEVGVATKRFSKFDPRSSHRRAFLRCLHFGRRGAHRASLSQFENRTASSALLAADLSL
jgi:hypothetical protein